MNHKIALGVLVVTSALSGCAGSRAVTLGEFTPQKTISTAALVPQDGNSMEMDSHLQKQLAAHGITAKPFLPAGTKRSTDVDAIVTYRGVWGWDFVKYLSSLTINLFDAPSGKLLASGRWSNAFLHGYPDEQEVVKEMMDDIYAKLSPAK